MRKGSLLLRFGCEHPAKRTGVATSVNSAPFRIFDACSSPASSRLICVFPPGDKLGRRSRSPARKRQDSRPHWRRVNLPLRQERYGRRGARWCNYAACAQLG